VRRAFDHLATDCDTTETIGGDSWIRTNALFRDVIYSHAVSATHPHLHDYNLKPVFAKYNLKAVLEPRSGNTPDVLILG
jgi:hypothetical protein